MFADERGIKIKAKITRVCDIHFGLEHKFFRSFKAFV